MEARGAAQYCQMHKTDPTSVIWSKMSLVLWLRNPDLEDAQKQRHYSANKVHIVKAMVVPVVMNSCESWMKEMGMLT